MRLAAFGDQCRAGVHEADEVYADIRRPGARALFEVDELLRDRQPASAELLRPCQSCEAGIGELALPASVIGTPRRPVVGWRRRAVCRNLLLQPGANLSAEGFVLAAVTEIHDQP